MSDLEQIEPFHVASHFAIHQRLQDVLVNKPLVEKQDC